MDVRQWRARWGALPRLARAALAYLAALAASALLGAWTIGIGSVVFIAGALCIFGSLVFIRHGGQRRVVTARAQDGKPLRKEWLPPEEREAEIRRGLDIFLVGIALWASVLAPLAFGVVVP